MTFDEWWASLEGTPHRHGEYFVTLYGEWVTEEEMRDMWKLLPEERI